MNATRALDGESSKPSQIILTLCMLVGLLPVLAHAFEIHGTVSNGSTGEPMGEATVTVVNPSGGMMVEQEVQTDINTGHFEVAGLKEGAPVYLLRVVYKGVNYTEMIQPDGRNQYEVPIRVFEPTTSWEKVHVSVPHVVARVRGDTLSVDRMFQIANHSDPPMTVYGSSARFVFYLPEDRLDINACYITSHGVPLPQNPVPTDEPGYYAIDYPIKPGTTTLTVSFDAPYAQKEYTYAEKLRYDLGPMMIITQDPTMQVASETVELEASDAAHGFSGYTVAALRESSPLVLKFTGGSGAAATGGGQTQVFVIPNASNQGSLVSMWLLAIALIGLFWFAVRLPKNKAEEEKVLRTRKDELLDQLAKLDDLYKTGTVSDQTYKLKRVEIMGQLAQIYYRTDSTRSNAGDDGRTTANQGTAKNVPKKKGAARA